MIKKKLTRGTKRSQNGLLKNHRNPVRKMLLLKSLCFCFLTRTRFFGKVAHVNSESFAAIFIWGCLCPSRFVTKNRFEESVEKSHPTFKKKN